MRAAASHSLCRWARLLSGLLAWLLWGPLLVRSCASGPYTSSAVCGWALRGSGALWRAPAALRSVASLPLLPLSWSRAGWAPSSVSAVTGLSRSWAASGGSGRLGSCVRVRSCRAPRARARLGLGGSPASLLRSAARLGRWCWCWCKRGGG